MTKMFGSRPQLRALSGKSANSERRSKLPTKLKDDAITEAVFEMRFTSQESDELEEVTVGRLLESKSWSEFTRKRLAFADIPRPLRQANEQLRHQPTAELLAADGSRKIRIGPAVVACHTLARYQGWTAFHGHIADVVQVFFEKVPDARVRRLGLRYVNALSPQRHGLDSVDQLCIDLRVLDRRITDRVNLNFITAEPPGHEVATRIATPDFVQGTRPAEAIVFVDIDVYTPPSVEYGTTDNVLEWIADAHGYAKDAFFELIPPELCEKMREV